MLLFHHQALLRELRLDGLLNESVAAPCFVSRVFFPAHSSPLSQPPLCLHFPRQSSSNTRQRTTNRPKPPLTLIHDCPLLVGREICLSCGNEGYHIRSVHAPVTLFPVA